MSVIRFATRSSVVLISSLGLGGALAAQNPQPRQWTVSRMEAEYSDPFTCVRMGSVRELADGRLMVADASEKRLEIIDFRTGASTPLGRQGAGPGEWGLPLSLSALGDTTLLYDPQNNRLLRIAPNGAIADATIPLPAGRGGFSLSGPRGYDAQGRLYYQGSAINVSPGQPLETSDSVAIARFDPRSGRIDTVAYLKVPRPEVQQSGGGTQQRITISMAPNPFLPSATWAVAPDGRVAIITPEPYRIEWVNANRTRSAGPALPYQRLRVTDADKSARGGGPQCSFSITRSSGGGTSGFQTSVRAAVGGGGGGGDGPAPRTDWPEFKPPFLASNASPPVASPAGHIWIERTRAANDPVPVYDVFDAQGRLIARATMPRGSRLLGFGRGVVYLSRMDEDDLVYIQRWKLDTP